MATITLTTDFGLQDWFVGTMKGVIRRLAPGAVVIDITHGIPPGDIRAAAFALAAACPYFPSDAIHVTVVDPGVGSARQALAARTDRGCFLGPDNGLLPLVWGDHSPAEIRLLTNASLFLPEVSRTFHGRDVFAAVAAHLANGVPLAEVGPLATSLHQLPRPLPSRKGDVISGEILYIDRFGNALTNIPPSLLPDDTQAGYEARCGKRYRAKLEICYASVASGQSVAVWASTGFLELAVQGGSAEREFNLCPGQVVTVRPTLRRKLA